MGHPTKYEQSEHSLRKENEWVAVIPGYCYHMGNISSSYGKFPLPEYDEFVNLIYPYQDGRGDICFQFNPLENKEFCNLPNRKVGAIMLAHNDENYIMQCLLSIQKLVDSIVIVLHDSKDRTRELITEFKYLKGSPEVNVFEWNMADNVSVLGWSTFNLADKINEGLKLLKDMDWVLHLEPDLILYEQENPDILRKASAYLELRGFNCMNLFMRDFVYDYGHINAVDYGEGVGNFYSERRFFKNENVSFKNPAHTCPSNVKDGQKVKRSYYRFWNEWQGNVAKTRYISMAHYGLTRGIERIRMRTYFKAQKPFIFWDESRFKKPEKVYDDIHQENTLYEWPIMQYRGRHPMYMGVD
jgi:glycosyltransferase involved in cell wall biosynthesis